ncbi:hypothetical protein BCR33DRAFT_725108 [Rhizoclosmatium globosum]|uniref:Uncharacterized protein n=1 Tax=Rhizoclosmatium globosum TaxID=329046 RepID=A0A1Y2B0N8_9FUNG|nr:hypothetical protein BCR33DRAFT_725108 [Rhizoclosmatium globosum]|eukprot:ORY28408.1 hypothetical protein BCR33DRAFT_725108 [Rhizoclosmatium globosum]
MTLTASQTEEHIVFILGSLPASDDGKELTLDTVVTEVTKHAKSLIKEATVAPDSTKSCNYCRAPGHVYDECRGRVRDLQTGIPAHKNKHGKGRYDRGTPSVSSYIALTAQVPPPTQDFLDPCDCSAFSRDFDNHWSLDLGSEVPSPRFSFLY